MILIGENLNVTSRTTGGAFRQRHPGAIRICGRQRLWPGVDLIDINLGPARRGGPELMEWVVKTVQQVTNTPLSLESPSQEAKGPPLKPLFTVLWMEN
jgi:5-methyltetrahydrofolate corrinoid/iron sulfur protein methyltransferase